MSASSAVYNAVKQIIKRYKKSPASLNLTLFPTHFRIEQLNGYFTYDSAMQSFIDDYVHGMQFPSELLDVLDKGKVPYYDGCLIVQIQDYRASSSTPSSAGVNGTPGKRVGGGPLSTMAGGAAAEDKPTKPDSYRVVLVPNEETRWADLSSRGLDERTLLETESRILELTTPPLCLDPSFECTRIANSQLHSTSQVPLTSDSASKLPLSPASALKRGRGAVELSDEGRREEEARVKRTKLMHVMDPLYQRGWAATFERWKFVESFRAQQKDTSGPTHVPPVAPNTSAAVAPPTVGQSRAPSVQPVARKPPAPAPVKPMAPPQQLKKKAAPPGPTGPGANKPAKPKLTKKQRDAQAHAAAMQSSIQIHPVGQPHAPHVQARPMSMASSSVGGSSSGLAVGVGLDGLQNLNLPGQGQRWQPGGPSYNPYN